MLSASSARDFTPAARPRSSFRCCTKRYRHWPYLVPLTLVRIGETDDASAIRAGQLEIVHDALQHIPSHDLQDCVFESHWIALFVFDVDALQVNSPELSRLILVRPLRRHRAFRRVPSRDPSQRGQFAHMPPHRSRLRGGKAEFPNVGRRLGALSGRCQRRNAPPVRCRRTVVWASATDGSRSTHEAPTGRTMRCVPRENPRRR